MSEESRRPAPPTIEATLAYAEAAHRPQRTDSGEPYFEHVAGVHAIAVRILALVPDEVMPPREKHQAERVAILHDTVDDTHVTGVSPDDLAREGHEPEVVSGVVRLAGRPAGKSYLENVQDMARERDLRVIVAKISDNMHNSLPERIACLAFEKQGIVKRYRRSLATLVPAFEGLTGVSLESFDPAPPSPPSP